MGWVGHAAHWKIGNMHRILVGRPEGKRHYKHRWEDNIKRVLGNWV
jgi:hypothetical protein